MLILSLYLPVSGRAKPMWLHDRCQDRNSSGSGVKGSVADRPRRTTHIEEMKLDPVKPRS
jgi:hypothetical protein